MNRTRFTPAFYKRERDAQKAGRQTAFARKYGSSFRKGVLMVGGLPITPEADRGRYLQKLLDGKAPMGVQSLFHFVKERTHGISRRFIRKWLSENKILRAIQPRGAGINPRIKRGNGGQTQFVLNADPLRLGCDLIRLNRGAFPRGYFDEEKQQEVSQIQYVFVLVQKASGLTWARAIKTNSAEETKKALQDGLAQFKAWGFRRPRGLESDGGPEFKAAFTQYLRKIKVVHYVLKLVSYVESRNQHLQRAMVMAAAAVP